MVQRKFPAPFWIVLLGSFILAISLMWPDAANAQCGSSASSCKNCHEVQAEYPVNNSGDWHTAHAFGDFCEFCHAGNVQATAQDEAHAGMEYPLENINASCLSCHPSDVDERAAVYAVALGVTVGSSGGGGTTAVPPSDSPPADAAPPAEPDTTADTAVADPAPASDGGAIVDYNRQYDLTVLNQREPVNVGNVILVILLVGMTGLAAYLIWRWEGLNVKWHELRGVPALAGAGGAGTAVRPTPRLRTPAAPPVPRSTPAALPQDAKLADLLAQMQQVDPETLASLTRLLQRPQGWPVVRAVGRIDARLVMAVQQLDVVDRDLLMAIVKEMDRE